VLLVVGERRGGLRLRELGLGQAALDLLGPLVEDLLERRQDVLPERDRDDEATAGISRWIPSTG